MPNTKQALKRHRQDNDRRMTNKVARSSMRTAMKNVLKATSRDEGEKLMANATKRIDKAAKKNIIHSNAAARFKRRLAKRVAALG